LEQPLTDSVTCHLKKKYGSCKELPFYREHEGKPYCVLHLSSEDKEDAFSKTLDEKFEREDFDFQGAFSPSHTAGRFLNRAFGGEANFYEATFRS